MSTVLSNTRNSNLYLAAALVIAILVPLTFAVAPAISALQSAPAPMARPSEAGSDYYLRHPELRISAALGAYIASDFYLRHHEWASNVQNAAIPLTGNSNTSDYFQRHSELSAPVAMPRLACESPVDCR